MTQPIREGRDPICTAETASMDAELPTLAIPETATAIERFSPITNLWWNEVVR